MLDFVENWYTDYLENMVNLYFSFFDFEVPLLPPKRRFNGFPFRGKQKVTIVQKIGTQTLKNI